MKRKITIYTVALVIILLILKMTFGYKKIFYTEIEEKNGIYMYMDKKLSGRVKGVDDYGDVSIMGIFKDGKIVGKYKDYFWANDLNRYCLYKDEKYDKNGLLTGERFEYYYKLIDENQNNVLYKEEFYIDGKKSGQNKIYHRNGNVHYNENYVDGKLEGERKLYYYTGKIKLKANYKNGKPVGNYTWYFENGNVKKQYFYNSNGLQDGLNKEFYDDGSIHREIFYVNGKKDGISRSYYKDGKKLYEGKYEAGNIVEGSTLYKDGSIAIYVDSEKVEEYSKQGHLTRYRDKVNKIIYDYNSKGRLTEINGVIKKIVDNNGRETIYKRDETYLYPLEIYDINRELKYIEKRVFNEFGLLESSYYKNSNGEYIKEKSYDDLYNLIAQKEYSYEKKIETLALKERYEKKEDIGFVIQIEEFDYDEKGRLIYEKTESFIRWHLINKIEYEYEENRLVKKRLIRSGKSEKYEYNGENLIEIKGYENDILMYEIYKEYDDLGRLVIRKENDYYEDIKEKKEYFYYKNTNMYLLVKKSIENGEGQKKEFIDEKNEYDDLGRLKMEYKIDEWDWNSKSAFEIQYYY